MRWKSLFLGTISLVLIIVVISFTEVQAIISFVYDNPQKLMRFLLLFIFLFFTRLIRNYLLFRINDFTQVGLLKFLPQAMVAGTVATYGPLKSGELLAMEIYYEYHEVERDQSLAVIVTGRILDVTVVLVFVSSAIFLIPGTFNALALYLVVMILVLVLLITFLVKRTWGMKLINIAKPLFVGSLIRVHDFIDSLLGDYYDSLEKIRNRPSLLVLFVLTMVRWLSEVIFSWLVFSSFSLDISIYEVIPLVGLSYAIGVSSGTPGALGTAQLTALGILVLLNNPVDISALSLVIAAAIGALGHCIMLLLGLIFTPFAYHIK